MHHRKNNRFVPPTDQKRAKGLGNLRQLSDDIRRAVTIGINECFLPFPIPEEGDWVTIHQEPGQTVAKFNSKRDPLSNARTIYVQPIGSFDQIRSPSLQTICEFSIHFFPSCRFEILPQIDFSDCANEHQLGKRINRYTKAPQYSADRLITYMKILKRKERKNDCQELFCIGVTMADIYAEPDWNFVYGLASAKDHIGVYSFARLDPSFPDTLASKPFEEHEQILMCKRAIGVFVHEIIHLFDVSHCIYYLCLMNGSESEEEMDSQPLYLCPICLLKMYYALKTKSNDFDVIKMYTNIIQQCKQLNFKDETEWYENRLKLLTSGTQ